MRLVVDLLDWLQAPEEAEPQSAGQGYPFSELSPTRDNWSTGAVILTLPDNRRKLILNVSKGDADRTRQIGSSMNLNTILGEAIAKSSMRVTRKPLAALRRDVGSQAADG